MSFLNRNKSFIKSFFSGFFSISFFTPSQTVRKETISVDKAIEEGQSYDKQSLQGDFESVFKDLNIAYQYLCKSKR